MRAEERARSLLEAGADEAQVVIALRGSDRLSQKHARYLVARVRAEILSTEAPKFVVRRGRERLVADAYREEGERVAELRQVGGDRRLAASMLQQDLFLKEFERVAEKVFRKRRDPVVRPGPKVAAPKKRVVNLVLSDLHFQSLLDGREVGVPYGPHEEARRLAAIVLKTCDYKRDHRTETECRVHLCGDIIQNALHDPRDAAPMAAQACAAIYLLEQALAHLASDFPRVKVTCATGNHGRNTARHPGRAVHEKWDSWETVIYFGLKRALARFGNVTVEIPRTPYYTFENFGHRGFVTHGDTVLNPGIPQRNIPVEAISAQVHKLNAAEAALRRKPFSVFVVGHTHLAGCDQIPNTDGFLIRNGALVPSDPYAVSLGNLRTRCSQVLWESTPDYMVGDWRSLWVGEEHDMDASLEKIIRPFEDF